jgi:hypothetical protein
LCRESASFAIVSNSRIPMNRHDGGSLSS